MLNLLIEDRIAEVLPTRLDVTGVTVRTTDANGDKSYPQLTVEVTGTQERDTDALRGVYDVTVEVHYDTQPEDTTEEAHLEYAEDLYDVLADNTRMTTDIAGSPKLVCWDCRGSSPETGPESGRRRTTVRLEVVAALQV